MQQRNRYFLHEKYATPNWRQTHANIPAVLVGSAIKMLVAWLQ
jgi:hypothetical protein